MITTNDINTLKMFAEVQANLIPGGILYGIIEDDTVTWRKASDSFDLDVLNLGLKLDYNSTTLMAIREKKVVNQQIPRSVYGVRLLVTSIPIVNEVGDSVGAFSMAIPKLHPITASFDKFAPILAEMFPEGVILYMTDLQKYIHKQSSKVLDLPVNEVGDELKAGDIPFRTIQTRQMIVEEVDASKYGLPLLVANYPLFDEDNENEVVATFGIVLPKKTAGELRDMSENLENGLGGISAAIEELAASASQIHENEQMLNTDIQGITSLSDEINQISVFIKEIADETKMLGLNAAIEAARAGDVGRGFGVVAEEIRKLSEQSKSTVPQIKELTDNIKSAVDKVIGQSNSSLQSSQEQAAASEEITASIEEITSISAELNRIAKQL